ENCADPVGAVLVLAGEDVPVSEPEVERVQPRLFGTGARGRGRCSIAAKCRHARKSARAQPCDNQRARYDGHGDYFAREYRPPKARVQFWPASLEVSHCWRTLPSASGVQVIRCRSVCPGFAPGL